MKMSKSAGALLKPHIPLLVCSLLEALSNLEPQYLNYLSLHIASNEDAQNKVCTVFYFMYMYFVYLKCSYFSLSVFSGFYGVWLVFLGHPVRQRLQPSSPHHLRRKKRRKRGRARLTRTLLMACTSIWSSWPTTTCSICLLSRCRCAHGVTSLMLLVACCRSTHVWMLCVF